MTPALILALALMATSNPPPAADTDAEPLPRRRAHRSV